MCFATHHFYHKLLHTKIFNNNETHMINDTPLPLLTNISLLINRHGIKCAGMSLATIHLFLSINIFLFINNYDT